VTGKGLIGFAAAPGGSCGSACRQTWSCGGSAVGRARARSRHESKFSLRSASLPTPTFRSGCTRRSSKRHKKSGRSGISRAIPRKLKRAKNPCAWPQGLHSDFRLAAGRPSGDSVGGVKRATSYQSLRSDGPGLRCRAVAGVQPQFGTRAPHRRQPATGHGAEGGVANGGETPPTTRLRSRRGRAFHERTTVERVNGRLKGEFGARMVRVRGEEARRNNMINSAGVIPFAADSRSAAKRQGRKTTDDSPRRDSRAVWKKPPLQKLLSRNWEPPCRLCVFAD
jgi:hypothetical protein